jgi:plastocyanin
MLCTSAISVCFCGYNVDMLPLPKLVGLLVVAVLALVFVLAFLSEQFLPQMRHSSDAPTSQTAARTPPLTASEMVSAQSPKGFQLLISYVDSGFEPRSATLHAGDTVRFTNNSTEALWVASIGAGGSQVYPGTSNCGGSPFDSCGALQPGEYWEFTFRQKGTWEFINNFDKSKTGSITVQ